MFWISNLWICLNIYIDSNKMENIVKSDKAKEAIESIKKAVLDNNADFGIIFDADGDRSAFIDNTGREINRNNLIALLSDILLKQTPGATIVTDSVTSAGLKKFIENHGGKHHRFKRGYKNVINEAKSYTNAIAMDMEDDYLTKENNLTGIAELWSKSCIRACCTFIINRKWKIFSNERKI